MVTANLSADPVSVTLGDGESVDVPTGEVWEVTITASYCARRTPNRFSRTWCNIDNVPITYVTQDIDTTLKDQERRHHDSYITNAVLDAGTTVDCQHVDGSGPGAVHVGGFNMRSGDRTIDNDPLTFVLQDESVTVPDGEVWVVSGMTSARYENNRDRESRVLVNGSPVAFSMNKDDDPNRSGGQNAKFHQSTLVGGDTVGHQTGSGSSGEGALISGWVVSQ